MEQCRPGTCACGRQIVGHRISGTDRYRTKCRSCACTERTRKLHPEPQTPQARMRRAMLKQKYGMTPEEFEAMSEAQGGACAACGGIPDGVLHVDHNHETGLVRGLLCNLCNGALGFARDDRDVLVALAAYLDRYT